MKGRMKKKIRMRITKEKERSNEWYEKEEKDKKRKVK
jgi:hypothetical protein